MKMKLVTAGLCWLVSLSNDLAAAEDDIDSTECLVNLEYSHCSIEPVDFQPPQFPERASTRGIVGWVRLSFTITADGSVSDIIIVDAEPRGILTHHPFARSKDFGSILAWSMV